jgi:hypothetical protein
MAKAFDFNVRTDCFSFFRRRSELLRILVWRLKLSDGGGLHTMHHAHTMDTRCNPQALTSHSGCTSQLVECFTKHVLEL